LYCSVRRCTIPVATLAAIEDTLELLSHPTALREIKAARDDVSRGRVVSAEELRAMYLRR